METIRNEIRKTPLNKRLEDSLRIIDKLASERRYLKMSIPVQPTDEDVFISITLQDALELISGIGCHAGSDGDCVWRSCPQLKNYKSICPLHKNDDNE